VPEAEAEESEPEAEAPKRPRRRRRAQAEPEAEEAQAKPPTRPAPSRRRARRDPNLPPPVVRAQARYVRSSARKARLVCDHIRGRSVQDARAILAHTPRAVARDWSKLLESAIANAENNHELVGEDLYIKAVHADEGPTIKRYRPRAMGRATRIRKRTSHLTILLTPKEQLREAGGRTSSSKRGAGRPAED
jgi:ribosomal protein L22